MADDRATAVAPGEWPVVGGQLRACDLSLVLLLVPPPLELYGAEVAEARVAALEVIEDLDELEDGRSQPGAWSGLSTFGDLLTHERTQQHRGSCSAKGAAPS